MCEMHTRKQLWRKAKVKFFASSVFSYGGKAQQEVQGKIRNDTDTDSSSKDKIDVASSNSKTITVEEGISTLQENKKSVQISNMLHVLLIQSRKEMAAYSDSLFWAEADYATFKKEAVNEIRAHISKKKMFSKTSNPVFVSTTT